MDSQSSSPGMRTWQDELLELLNKPTAKQTNDTQRFRTSGGSKLKEFCRSGTREDCARINGTGCA